MRPVEAGMWFQRETFDGTYTLDDLLDVHELLDVKEANIVKFRKHMEAK